jgi:uncharacterized protein (TIGR02118 family)
LWPAKAVQSLNVKQGEHEVAWAYLVIYEGRPDDPEAFVRYYREHHLPLVRKFPKLRGLELLLSEDVGEAGEREPDRVFMIARMLFDSLDDLKLAVTSPQRAAARADMSKFPPFHGRVHRRAVRIEDVYT